MIKPIFVYGTSVLRKAAKDIDKNFDGLDELIKNMFQTMYATDGVGLAAPQVGKSISLFVIDPSPFADEDESLEDFKRVFINAEMIEESGNEWLFNEGCLSVPGIREDVKRKKIIKLNYLDENFVEHTEVFDGMKARVIQHEYDHLKGVLLKDRLNPLKKTMLKGKIKAIIKGKVDVKYKIKHV